LIFSHLGLILHLNKALQNDKASFLGFGFDDDRLALLPHVDDEGLAGEDVGGESRRELLQLLGVIGEELLVDSLGSHAVGAEAVEDRNLESSHSRHLGVDMERVHISVESVEEGLVLGSRLLEGSAGCSLWDRRIVNLESSLMAEATRGSNEYDLVDLSNELLGFLVGNLGFVDNHERLAFVLDVGDRALH